MQKHQYTEHSGCRWSKHDLYLDDDFITEPHFAYRKIHKIMQKDQHTENSRSSWSE